VKREARALIGYLPQLQAAQLLHGDPATSPDLPGLTERWTKARDLVQSRPKFEPADPILDMPAEAHPMALKIEDRSDIKAVMGNIEWSVRFVDLSAPIVTYQPVLVSEDAVTRVSRAASGNLADLFEVCLPPSAEQPVMTAFEPSQNALTATSLNPNLRIGGFVATEVAGSGPTPQKVFGFTLSFGAPYVQLTRYQERWMVRDGHHRLYGLLRLGITKIPALVVHARTLEETGAGRPGFFGYEVIFGDRPPLFSDFLNESFSSAIQVQATRKIIRVRAEEFAVPI
jgi:hypothetical protein